jgi:hypothetical protein
MKYTGLTKAEKEEFERLRVKLYAAQQAAAGAVKAYDEALDEMRVLVEAQSFDADRWYDDRREKWRDERDGTQHRAAVLLYKRDWHHASINLLPIADAMRDHEKLLNDLPQEPK